MYSYNYKIIGREEILYFSCEKSDQRCKSTVRKKDEEK